MKKGRKIPREGRFQVEGTARYQLTGERSTACEGLEEARVAVVEN